MHTILRQYGGKQFFPLLALVIACGGEEPQILNVHMVLNQTQEALKERFGEPDISVRRAKNIDTMQWKSADGDSTWVYVVVRDGRSCYVTYTFKNMEPFDGEGALRRLGIEAPTDEPEYVWENGVKRWKPFGRYEKLTLSPITKAVTVGAVSPLLTSDG